MFGTGILRLVLQLAAIATGDTARIAGDRLIVEPLGFSIEVPALWLGKPGPPNLFFCDVPAAGTVSDRILTDRSKLEQLRDPRGEWKREYAAVVDSVMPFGAFTAHLGGDPWNGTCDAPQVRVYVQDSAAPSPRSLAQSGVESAERFFKPVQKVQTDSAGWELTRISWEGFYYDYGGTAQVEFWSRRIRNRRVTLVFTYTPYVEHHRAMLTSILHSVRF
jgi:hypothetical protein